MFGRRKKAEGEKPEVPNALKDAVRDARIEAAERSAVVVDTVELFDCGISQGDMPRLWVDVIAYVQMGRDKRQYRFLQDTRYGRTVLAESYEVPEMVQAVTRYVARRLVERERALADDAAMGQASAQKILQQERRRRRWAAFRTFIYGLIVGIGALFVLAMLNNPKP